MTAGSYSIPEVKRLLAVLVASKPDGKVAEMGTSYGDGALAIVAALPPRATFVTVEIDPDRAAAARVALAGTRAEVVEGDWRDVLPARAPFDLIFFDGGQREALAETIDLLAPGGILVKDDLTPDHADEGSDRTRLALLEDERLEATEVLVTAEMAAIVAVRKP